jgi:GT2 family glycosyltransferase
MVTITVVTWNRYELIEKCVGPALKGTDTECELFWIDNGSTDERIKNYMLDLNPKWYQINSENLGYAPMHNQMFLRSNSDYLCMIDPDISLPYGWLRNLVECNKAIPNTGLAGLHCVQGLPSPRMHSGKMIHPSNDIFGIKFFNRSVLNKVGYLCEDYGLYGVEDRDYNNRVNLAGFFNYYVGGMRSIHEGEDGEVKGDAYRDHKWKCLEIAYPKLIENTSKYNSDNYYVGPPPLKEFV